MHKPASVRQSRGLTLVEMLVTLVVLSVVTTLLWQALALTARLEQSLAREQEKGRDAPLRQAWLQRALEGLVVPPGVLVPLQGSQQKLGAITTAPPWPSAPGPEAFALELRQDGGTDGLPADAPAGADKSLGSNRLRLWALRPATGEMFDLGARPQGTQFAYLDAEGRWLDAWPPDDRPIRPESVQRPLPRAIRLAEGTLAEAAAADIKPPTGGAVALAAPQASRNPMLTRQQASPPDDTR